MSIVCLETFTKIIIYQIGIDKFWNKVAEKNSVTLSTLILSMKDEILLLPHLSASCERLFSSVNLNRTKFRNKIEDTTLSSLKRGKEFLSKSGGTCFSYKVPEKILRLHNSKIY